MVIRCANRIIKGERWKIEKRRGKTRNVIVIGDDKKGRTMIKGKVEIKMKDKDVVLIV